MIHLKLEEFLKDNGKSLYWLTVKTGRSYQSLKNLTKSDLYGIHFVLLGELLEMIDEKESGKHEQNTEAV